MKEIVFTGRNVPIEELSSATGKSVQFIKRGLRDGVFDFGYALKCENSKQYRYFCPDKLVWEKTGYFAPSPDNIIA